MHKAPGVECDVHVEHEVRDRDSEKKSKCKAYADARRNASYSDVLPLDHVLVQQEKRNKFSTPFNPNPFMVVSKHGNSLVVHPPPPHQCYLYVPMHDGTLGKNMATSWLH